MRTHLDVEYNWDEQTSKKINSEYVVAKLPKNMSDNMPIYRFMAEECDFSIEHVRSRRILHGPSALLSRVQRAVLPGGVSACALAALHLRGEAPFTRQIAAERPSAPHHHHHHLTPFSFLSLIHISEPTRRTPI
eukprot:6214484-Pleurochrysis_carterae.AAC.4